MSMTISQVLRRIAKLKGEHREELERATAGLNWQAENPPAFSFNASWERAAAISEELIKLETALRLANARVTISVNGGATMTLAEATCRLQALKARIAMLRDLPSLAQAEVTAPAGTFVNRLGIDQALRVQRSVQLFTTTLCALPAAKRADAVREAQAEFDALNDVVERANHEQDV